MPMNEWIGKLKTMTPEEKLATVTLDDILIVNNTILLQWSGAMGFGEYSLTLSRIYTENDHVIFLTGDSEGLDLRDDKKLFLRHLLSQLADKVDLSEERAYYDGEEDIHS